MSEIKNYDKAYEDLFINILISNSTILTRVLGILKPSYFDNLTNQKTVEFVLQYCNEYSTVPLPEQIKAVTGANVELVTEIASKHDTWALSELEEFCKYKALRDAILASPELIDEGRYGEVESAVKSAVQIALVKDLGTDYFANPKERLEAIREGKGQISSGWKAVDEKLYGGLNRGEITIFAGQCVVATTKVKAVKLIDIECDITSNSTICEKVIYLSQFYKIEKLLSYKENNIDLFNKLYIDMQPKEYNIIDLNNKENWYVDSPDGYVKVKGLICKGTEDIIKITFTDNTKLYTSPFHMMERDDGEWLSTLNLFPNDKLVSRYGYKTIYNIVDIKERDLVFDLVVDSDNHRYYTDGISSHNSGAGKSLFLQNMAVSWSSAGLNVIYLSLELSENLCSMRIDAMNTGYDTREVMKNIEDVHMKIRASQQKNKGTLQIKQLPNGCTANDVRAFIKEYEIHKGIKVDAILIDYLDLMMPMSKKISAENLFVKDKYVTEELRNLAVELDILTVTASQLNRSSYDEVDFDPSHVAGGISKINTADNVIGIFTSAAMRESGRYQIQFMKTRSSSGVGSKIDLCFDRKSLRISDLDEEDDSAIEAASTNIMEKLKRSSGIKQQEKTDNTAQVVKALSNKPDPLEGAAALRAFIKKR